MAFAQVVFTMVLLSFWAAAETGNPTVDPERPPAHGDLDLTFYVSIQAGNDSHPGSKTAPFQTIRKAQERVREVIAGGMSGDVTVLIRGGEYYLDTALTFDERDSGRDGHQVIYRSYPDEEVKLIGGKPITGWIRAEGDVFVAEVGQDWQPNVLTENGELATLARMPNEGYLSVEGVPEGTEAVQFTYREGDLPTPFDFRHAQVLAWAGYDEQWDGGKNYNWESSLLPITHVDFEARTITLAGPTIRRLHRGNRYYVRGAREFLDRPGEFWCDSAAGLLYYWPRQTPIEAQTIVGSTTPRVLELVGRSRSEPLENVVFQGLTLEQCRAFDSFGPSQYLACDGLVYLSNARNITIRDCRIRHSGKAGIALDLANRSHKIEGNLIEDAAYHGVAARGFWIGNAPFDNAVDAYVNRDHVISNNGIRRCGRLIGQAAGVWLYQSGDNEVSHNLIEDMPRFGVQLIGHSFFNLVSPTGLGGKLFGQAITWENHLDFLYTRHNRIVFNEIRDCMKDSQDGGGIYAYGTGAHNLIANNLVHHFRPAVTEGSVAGIYLDDAANLFTVARNIVAHLGGCRYVYPLIIKGYGHVVTDNILADNEAHAAIYVLQTPHGGLPEQEGLEEELVDQLRFTRNILYRNTGLVYQIYPWKDTILAESDYHVIYRPEGGYACAVDWKWETWDDWQGRGNGRYERHTLLADPLFADPDSLDYTLQAGSPALENGFTPIDTARIGLRADFAFRNEMSDTGRKPQP